MNNTCRDVKFLLEKLKAGEGHSGRGYVEKWGWRDRQGSDHEDFPVPAELLEPCFTSSKRFQRGEECEQNCV